ncbi:hypothetical protein ANO11243_061520 [Dothideomycetidae sp. 11243]|nr:hypothetical protein ANO11243_061520 [fungal sp. No.11243]
MHPFSFTDPFQSTLGYYNFSNIRYAAPPVGDLRWAAPQSPAQNRSVVQNGQDARICPQAYPGWYQTASQFVPEYLSGQRKFNDSAIFVPNNSVIPPQDPQTNEDCLFLDVFVPEDVWAQRASGKKVPVLFWIFGGGYTYGSKTSYGSPAGLLARSENNSMPGVIYVAPNYRLGAFGWLSGPTFQQDGGLANAGLYDQRKALEWVHENIHLFGGDADQITVFGQSAGGGSIVHQITAFGGNTEKSLFKRAIPQSPGFQVTISQHQQQNTFLNFLKQASVSSLAQARALPYWQVQAANILTTAVAEYGTFTYGPVVDGVITPSIPGQLLARGQFDKNVSVMVGQNKDEGLSFTSPFLANDDANSTRMRDDLLISIPTLHGLPDQVDYIMNTLYPPIFDGSQAQGYTDQITRMAALSSEFAFICNDFYLDKALDNNTYAYLFDVFPATHGSDAPYTFYSPDSHIAAPAVAIELQEYITAFAETGTPNEPGVPYFKSYANGSQVTVLAVNGIRDAADPAADQRCDYWQAGLWY